MSRDKFLKEPTNLLALLEQADKGDVDVLIDYITDSGKGRISLSKNNCTALTAARNSSRYNAAAMKLIADEIRNFGGNSLVNFFRSVRADVAKGSSIDAVLPSSDPSVDYGVVVRDVAKHLKLSTDKTADVVSLEEDILRKIARDAFEHMSPEERTRLLEEAGFGDALKGSVASAAVLFAARAGGFSTYKIALMVANSMSKLLLNRGLPLVTNAALTRTLGIALGPVGWVVTGLWTLADFSSPAYRVTVPCVIQLAYMRQRALTALLLKPCASCGEDVPREAKFCPHCGTAMTSGA